MEEKYCKFCSKIIELSVLNFRECTYPSGKKYFKNICKSCESKNNVNYNKKRGKTPEQKEKEKVYKKQWKIKNKKKINKKYKEKLHTDSAFKLRKNISNSIRKALKNQSSIKKLSIKKYLDWEVNDLKEHLEKKFDYKMSWDNYGIYWHIDHIVPQSCLPYKSMDEENFKKCWSLNNLRPLEARKNMMDGSTRIRHKIFKDLTEKYNG